MNRIDGPTVAIFTPDLHKGGIAKVVKNSAEALARKHRVEIIVYDSAPVDEAPQAEVGIHRLGLTLYSSFGSTPARRIARRAARIAALPIAVVKTLLLVRRLRPTVLISHSDVCNFISLILNRFADNVVLVDHGPIGPGTQQTSGPLAFLTRLGQRALYHRADGAVAISQVIADDYVDLGIPPDRVFRIPNSVDVQLATAQPADNPFGDDRPYFVNVGRLNAQKGQHHLLRAFVSVHAHRPDVGLAIVGDGPLKQTLERLVQDLRLSESVLLLGWQDDPTVFVRDSHAFVSSSLYEGFPIAHIEALACGRTVIATDCVSGPREILSPNTSLTFSDEDAVEHAEFGILVPVPDGEWREPSIGLSAAEQALANAMVAVANDAALREHYERVGAQRALDYSPSVIDSKWISLVRAVVSESGGSGRHRNDG